MGITITVEEDLLTAAAKASRISDRTRLVEEALRLLCRNGSPAPFDFDHALEAAADFPELDEKSAEEFAAEINRPAGTHW